ncbi:HigA family addiction module antitoxin [Formosa algae]|uniref:HigA family addiction module antitoxin n=1 Tax=Formosa algae TaxID=225843 RepID=UPI000CCEC8E3|nr:HigA family addiction module antitoxin [Formosa algae]PNW27221.1 addiction module antidote protein, HigA family [Formosa algae]
MRTIDKLTPFIATHPGEVLWDEMQANDFTQIEFAKLIDVKRSQLNEIIKGKRNINADLALLFEKGLGIDANYWLELQKNYDLDKAKIEAKNQERLEAIEQWNFIKPHIAFTFLKKQKYIFGDPVLDIPTIKDIYGVNNLESIASLNAKKSYARFRKSTKLKLDKTNVIGWAKLVQFNARKAQVKPFEANNMNNLIEELIIILNENKDTKYKTQQVLNEYGIKLIYQEKGEKTPVDGISFWDDNNPAIGLSLRYNRLDYFAFTLFHELGHVYKHLVKNNDLEYIDIEPKFEGDEYSNSKEEKEANTFANDFLIDNKSWIEFINNKDSVYKFKDETIIAFAESKNIHPAIVKGRLCNHFKNYKIKSNIPNEIL